jgi:2-haloalkanoic acid dehalogenase type II
MDNAPLHLHAVAFDLYGTLLDIGTLAAEVDAAAGAGTLQKWRAAQLRRTWELNAQGAYQPFDQVTAEALLEVAPHLAEPARIKLCELWLMLPAHPDAQPALRQLKARGLKVGVLSNGTVAMIRAALGAAGINVDFVLSADQVKQYKPDRQVYALLDQLGPAEETLFVSANGWDAEGAKKCNRLVAFLERGNAGPNLEPDLRAASLSALALQIAPNDWHHHGVSVIKGGELDPNTKQTPGMNRAAAINHARVGAEKLWAGTVTIHPNAKTGAHHHGDLESVIYVVRGQARMRWGDHLEFTAEAGPGDFIYVPPYVPHQEINANPNEALECVLVRSGQEPVVVNLAITPKEPPEDVKWIDSIHRE